MRPLCGATAHCYWLPTSENPPAFPVPLVRQSSRGPAPIPPALQGGSALQTVPAALCGCHAHELTVQRHIVLPKFDSSCT
jgi:hypothetical protein